MRYAPIVALACLLSGCGSSPTQPTPTPTPTPAPQPAPPPAPVYPVMAGGWTGRATVTATVRQTGERGTNVCDQSWVITTQSSDTFTGTWQISGGTTFSCGQGGPLSGHVTPTGDVALDFNAVFAAAPGCTRSEGAGAFTGVVTNERLVTAQTTDVLQCTVNGTQITGDRLLSIEMTKR